MKKCYLDSNILVYLKDDLSPHQKKAVQILTRLIEKEVNLYISPLVLDEFLYVFKYGLNKKKIQNIFLELKRALNEVLEIPSLSLVYPPLETKRQITVVDYMRKYNLSPRDAYHLLTIKANDIDFFATFDDDFKKVFAEKEIKPAIMD